MDTVSITGGIYRGRKITTPGGMTHPMGSRERLALFNMLTGKIEDSLVLDAFAGSGALGIEALSRGAKSVIFVDKSAKSTEVIKKNLLGLGISDKTKVIKGSAKEISGEFDIILADPPYDNFDLTEVEPLVKTLKTGGIMVLSHPKEAPKIDNLTLVKSHQYAAAHLSVYTKD